MIKFGLSQWLSSKESICNAEDAGDVSSVPGLGRCPGGGHGNPFQYSWLENLHVQRSLAGYSLWGHKELNMTERLSTAHSTPPPVKNRPIHTHTHRWVNQIKDEWFHGYIKHKCTSHCDSSGVWTWPLPAEFYSFLPSKLDENECNLQLVYNCLTVFIEKLSSNVCRLRHCS